MTVMGCQFLFFVSVPLFLMCSMCAIFGWVTVHQSYFQSAPAGHNAKFMTLFSLRALKLGGKSGQLAAFDRPCHGNISIWKNWLNFQQAMLHCQMENHIYSENLGCLELVDSCCTFKHWVAPFCLTMFDAIFFKSSVSQLLGGIYA